jgi:hypothetical protein
MENKRIIDLDLVEFQHIIEELLKKHIRDAIHNKEGSEELLTRAQMIKRLHISPSTLALYTNNKILTSYYIGHRVFYKWSEILNAGIKAKK